MRIKPATDGGEGQAVVAVSLNHASDEANESAGRSSNLKATPSDKGNNEATGNGGIKAALKQYSGGDGDGHRQRQRNNSNGEPGHGISPQISPAVTFAENRNEFWREQFDEAWLGKGGGCGVGRHCRRA
jgi:hypothetical protein